jgi:CheY-like chemotaxis protein
MRSSRSPTVQTRELPVRGKDGTGLDQKGNALLILLDLNLPDMTGIDILKQVKENKYLKASPVVVLTTTDDSQEIKRCYELGCNVYITKPVNYESFRQRHPPARPVLLRHPGARPAAT